MRRYGSGYTIITGYGDNIRVSYWEPGVNDNVLDHLGTTRHAITVHILKEGVKPRGTA